MRAGGATSRWIVWPGGYTDGGSVSASVTVAALPGGIVPSLATRHGSRGYVTTTVKRSFAASYVAATGSRSVRGSALPHNAPARSCAPATYSVAPGCSVHVRPASIVLASCDGDAAYATAARARTSAFSPAISATSRAVPGVALRATAANAPNVAALTIARIATHTSTSSSVKPRSAVRVESTARSLRLHRVAALLLRGDRRALT